MPERPTASVYWRRRFVALIIGLSTLALLAWACASALGSSTHARHSSGAKSLHRVPHTRPSASVSTAAVASDTRTPTASASAASTSAASHGTESACPNDEVVLSVFVNQASYSVRQTPVFQVDVVSTASSPCTLDIGAKHVLLKISAGSRRIWTSADCAEGDASVLTRLRRGVPVVVAIAWNEEHSSRGCPVPGAAAKAGTYTAVAIDGSNTSNVLRFRIG